MASPEAAGVPRLAPELPLPPYAYVSGQFPHPFSHPEGHRHCAPAGPLAPPEPARWHECRAYLHGLDLFNRGYYWEAHETWERLWHACGRAGPTADFFKGLIKLTAAGVKAREGRPEGVRSHARRAAELFRRLASLGGGEDARCLGLALTELIAFAGALAERPEAFRGERGKPVEVLFPFMLMPAPLGERGALAP
jgi:hypothetical protein